MARQRILLTVVACAINHLLVATVCLAQKPPVDTSLMNNWQWPANPAISNDGRYASYTIERWGSSASQPTVVRALQDDWKVVLPGVDKVQFSDDSRHAFLLTPGDTLRILTLGSAAAEALAPVAAFRLFKQGSNEWLAYELSTPNKGLVLRNLKTGARREFPGAAEYAISKDGNTIAVLTQSTGDSTADQTLTWVHLAAGQQTGIWRGRGAHHLVLDVRGGQLAFSVGGKADAPSALWYYGSGATGPALLVDNRASGIDRGLHLGDATAFSSDGRRLFLNLNEEELKPDSTAVKVDVWSYTDAKLQSQQLAELWPRNYLAVIGLDAPHRVLRLQQADEERVYGRSEEFVLFDRRQGDAGDYNWAITGQPLYALVSTKTGERKTIQLADAELSPAEKYVTGKDDEGKNLYAYEVATGVTRNLTASLPIPLIDRGAEITPQTRYRPLWIASWSPDDEAVRVNDRFDIWQIDPSGKKAPVNLTNGFGRRHNVVFRDPRVGAGTNPGCLDNECRILSAFDLTNKDDGYYRIASRSGSDPDMQTMGPYAYFPFLWEAPLPTPPMKARDADVYLLPRESATSSRNYFWTRDFRSFTPVSDVRLERGYTWPTAELATFTTLNGHTVQGVLYKPATFDPRKKYPVIIHYYETKSETLNHFRRLGASGPEVDIIWFTSHGYLVFAPDIYNTMGETGPGQDAMNTVIAAADHLSRFRWVDSTRMGLQGHSFGGYYTNFIIAHSNRFAAAVSSAGSSDIISEYGALWGGGKSKMEFVENRHFRMDASLWQRPDLYIKNSPIFDADKVTTPVLIVANKKDANVPFEQGLAFFTALRRLGKRVWMLQYDESSHGVDGKDRTDYVIRMTQFFDHYLKGAPPPKWMTRGVPARLKRIDSGLELDTPGKTPGPGLLVSSRRPATGKPQWDQSAHPHGRGHVQSGRDRLHRLLNRTQPLKGAR
jgi:dienelactone hydrolase